MPRPGVVDVEEAPEIPELMHLVIPGKAAGAFELGGL